MAEFSAELTMGMLALASFLIGFIGTYLYCKRVQAKWQAELISARSQAEANARHYEDKAGGLATELSQLKTEQLALQTSKNQAEQQLARIQTEAEGLHRLIGDRDQRIQSLETQLADEKAKSDTAHQSISALREQSKGHQMMVERLQEQLQETKTHLQEKLQEYDTLRHQYGALQGDFGELKTTHNEKLANFEEQKQHFEQTRQQLKTEFQNLANQILEEKGKTFTQNSQSALDALLKPFREQIEGFQKRVNEVHSESVKGNATLESEIKKVLDVGMKMSSEAHTLTTALKGDKKTTGNWGEIQLERTLQLAGLTRGDHYEAQEGFKTADGKNRHPDFVVKLPDDKHMVIDSKVSLVDYDKAISAETDGETQLALDAHAKAVRNHIDDLSKKDYSNLIGIRSPSFVLMFMPIEPAYIEALKHNKELFNYGYQRNVIMVSHTTLMPILRTVANLWMIERSNEEAREISEKAGDIYNQVCTVAERLHKLGGTLGTVNNHYNNTVKALAGQQGLHGKVERFSTLSAKVRKSMPHLEPLHTDIEKERLALIVEPVEETPDADTPHDHPADQNKSNEPSPGNETAPQPNDESDADTGTAAATSESLS